ncbi:trichohyalin-like isoform X5 [Daphnia pulex]|uniref:trichohyalin-like isoform X5 n=1 Tax=Daphnia pulex TaxID=6669 RepID=UPI001EE01AD3|nr:trichohyalin-like isoform X5 [Daphnia pulex]
MESNDHCELDQSEMVKRLKKKKKTLGRVLSKKKDKAKKERLAAIKIKYGNVTKKKSCGPPADWDLHWGSMSEKEQRNLSRRQSHAVASLLKKMEDMETQFGASILANIRFPNGSQQSLYTMKVGEGIKFAESSEGLLFISSFKRYFNKIQKRRMETVEEVRGLSTKKKKCFADKQLRKELRKDKTTTLPEYSDSESAHELKSDEEENSVQEGNSRQEVNSDQERRIETVEEVRGLSTTKKKCFADKRPRKELRKDKTTTLPEYSDSESAHEFKSDQERRIETVEEVRRLSTKNKKCFADKRPRKELRKDKTTTLPEYSDSESAHEFKSDQERRIETVEEVRRLSTKNKKCFADKRLRKELRKDKTTTLPEHSESGNEFKSDEEGNSRQEVNSGQEVNSDQERRIETVEEVRGLSMMNKKYKRQRKELLKGKTTTLPEHSQLEGKVSRQEDQLLPSTPMMQPIVLVKKLDLSLINSLINNWKK